MFGGLGRLCCTFAQWAAERTRMAGEGEQERVREGGKEMDICRKESLGYLWVNEYMYVQCKDARPPLFRSEI